MMLGINNKNAHICEYLSEGITYVKTENIYE